MKAWTIYNPLSSVENLRLFKTRKAAQAEWDRIYSGDIRNIIKKYAPNAAQIIKVELYTLE